VNNCHGICFEKNMLKDLDSYFPCQLHQFEDTGTFKREELSMDTWHGVGYGGELFYHLT